MMENEELLSALKKVKEQKENFGFMDRFNVDENWEVMKALEEIQQYRAIGTVEELQTLKEHIGAQVLRQYEAIGTVEEFKALKEKNEPKKIVSRGQGHEADCYCPNCNAFLGNDQDWCFNQTNHCSECGQALET